MDASLCGEVIKNIWRRSERVTFPAWFDSVVESLVGASVGVEALSESLD
jgi:hypothetical protein